MVVEAAPGAIEVGDRELIDNPAVEPVPTPVVPAKTAVATLGVGLLSITCRV
jgi:hypothetical protein